MNGSFSLFCTLCHTDTVHSVFPFLWYVSGNFRLNDIRNRKEMLFPVDLNTYLEKKPQVHARESEILSVSPPPQKKIFNPLARGKKDTWTLLRGTREPCAFFCDEETTQCFFVQRKIIPTTACITFPHSFEGHTLVLQQNKREKVIASFVLSLSLSLFPLFQVTQ